LGTRGGIRFLYAEANKYPLVYERTANGQRFIIVINPSGKAVKAECSFSGAAKEFKPVLVDRTSLKLVKDKLQINADGVSYGLFMVN